MEYQLPDTALQDQRDGPRSRPPRQRNFRGSRGAGRGGNGSIISSARTFGSSQNAQTSAQHDRTNLHSQQNFENEQAHNPTSDAQIDTQNWSRQDDGNFRHRAPRASRSRGRHYQRAEHSCGRPVPDETQGQETQPFHNQVNQQGTTISRRARGRGGRHQMSFEQKYQPSEGYPGANQLAPNSSTASTKLESNIQSEISESKLKTNSFECMICCDNITRFHPIWYCSNCYNIFHLKCAIEWCNKSIKSRNEAIASAQYPSLGQGLSVPTGMFGNSQLEHSGFGDYQKERMNSIEWPCPACREVLHSRPDKYKCFCGKVIRPEVNKHLTPHSCGQLCGRRRPGSDCPHTCNTICHPGKCSPCPLTSKKVCHCGKVTQESKCVLGITSCDQQCGKPLTCGKHFCSKICHSGSCGTCSEIIEISCRCSKERVQKRCEETDKTGKQEFSCDKICGKPLDCGKHICLDKCHYKCKSCKLLSANIKTCPCGSTNIKKSLLNERNSCTDPVPTCQNRCNRVLPCGPEKNHHKCQKKCHTGPCPPCKLRMAAYCGCKLSTKTIECSVMYKRIVENDQVTYQPSNFSFKCELRCNKPKNCGRHRCNKKCCDFTRTQDPSLHLCDQTCNKKLPCGVHACPERCHPGQCGDCTNIGWTELTCHCGGTVLYPPIPCGARPPACHRPCRRPHNCGHPVKHECHDDQEKCAPCTIFVTKSCFCGADSKDSVYCYLPGYSCGRTCKRKLSCKQHSCQRVCHDNDCETPNERGVIICNQTCQVARFLCKHPCGLPCHGRTPCPTSLCKQTIELTCACGNRTERTECHKLSRDVDNQNKVAMMTTNRSNQDSIMIDLSRKTSTSVENETVSSRKRLDCDETCSIFKRNKALSEALEIAQPDLKPVNIFGEDPLRLLREATAYDYKFVSATFNSLAKLVKSAKESDKRFIFMAFPPADKLRREVVQELAYHFNCTSESRDEEPFRHVVVRAYKNKSAVPDFTIGQLLPVSD